MSRSAYPNDSGASISPWMRVEVPSFDAALPDEVVADVCVIGAGIAGLSAAYFAAREGKRVVVIDDGPIGGGETSRTTAHLAYGLDDRFTVLEKHHGVKGARLAAASHAAAVDRIEAICRDERIDCGFKRVDGYLFNAPTGKGISLERELGAAHRARLLDVELVFRAPIPDFDTGPALRFPRQGQFHPLKYVRGLADAITRYSGAIFTGVRADRIIAEPRLRVVTSNHRTIFANAIVVATNAPITSPVSMSMKQAAYRTYVVALIVPRGSIPEGLYWDTEDPYHYVRLLGEDAGTDHDLLIVGGEDHKTGQADDAERRWERLEAWTRERFPMCAAVSDRWSGQVMEPIDELGFIGPTPGGPDGVYIITGDSGHGMTHGTIGGMLVTDLALGRPNEWATLYDPSRRTLRATGELVREGMNVAAQYADWARGGDVTSVDQIPPRGGAVIRQGVKMLAVYRDADGCTHTLSATCRHLGGVVHWNHAEESWDCPCHGSRYDAYGRVINGPAKQDLQPIDEEPRTTKPAKVEPEREAPAFSQMGPATEEE
jgi:glycine/D-amino acid oxidase-like deaminating enzyme/nitrite reductase/ring-hydroxylating ferredoxin subunit